MGCGRRLWGLVMFTTRSLLLRSVDGGLISSWRACSIPSDTNTGHLAHQGHSIAPSSNQYTLPLSIRKP